MRLTDVQIDTLVDILTYRRPMGSRTEEAFRAKYVYPLPGAYVDVFGNVHVSIGESRILWSSHTDTVHSLDGRQTVNVDRGTSIITLRKRRRRRRRHRGECLGADDGVGVFLMREMIAAHVPGHYIFHYGEERGGVGSGKLATHNGDWLTEHFDYAIALDRAGTSDVITHQFGERTASTAFAVSLAAQLPGAYFPAEGVYTDTAEYTAHIPECTNISVGYGRQHTADEFVHYGHVGRLLHCLINLDERGLVIGDKWTETLAERRPDRAGDTFVESDDDYFAKVWCEQCDEPKHACICDDLSADDIAFMRYLKGLD